MREWSIRSTISFEPRLFPVHLRLTPMAPVRTRHCRPLHHVADCLSEIQSFHVFTQADGPQLQTFCSIKDTLKDPFPGVSSAFTFSVSLLLLPLTPFPALIILCLILAALSSPSVILCCRLKSVVLHCPHLCLRSIGDSPP